MNCPNVIRAISAGYKELMEGNKGDYERRHLVLRSALIGVGIDPDRLPEDCGARIEALDALIQ